MYIGPIVKAAVRLTEISHKMEILGYCVMSAVYVQCGVCCAAYETPNICSSFTLTNTNVHTLTCLSQVMNFMRVIRVLFCWWGSKGLQNLINILLKENFNSPP